MKKFLSLLLVMLLAVTPVLSIAEEAQTPDRVLLNMQEDESLFSEIVKNGRRAEYTVTVGALDIDKLLPMLMDGEDVPEEDQAEARKTFDAINELLAILKVEAYTQDDGMGLTFSMNGNEILTTAFSTNEEEILLQSNLLGDTPVLLRKAEVEKTLERVIQLILQAQGLSEKAIAESLEEMQEMLEELSTSLTTSLSGGKDLMTLDVTAVAELLSGWEARLTPVDMTEVPTDCDTPAYAKSIVLTENDAREMLNTLHTFLKDNEALANYINLELNGAVFNVSGEGNDSLEDLLEEAAELEIGEGKVLVTLFFNENNEIVKAVIKPEEDVTELTFTRKTAEENTLYSIRMEQPSEETVTEAGSIRKTVGNLFSVDLLVSDAQIKMNMLISDADGVSVEGVLDVTQETSETSYHTNVKTEIKMTQQVSEDYSWTMGYGWTVDLLETVEGSDAQRKMTFGMDIMGLENIITLSIEGKTCDPQPPMSSEGALELNAASDDELKLWFAGVMNNVSTIAFTVLLSLPQSLLEMMY